MQIRGIRETSSVTMTCVWIHMSHKVINFSGGKHLQDSFGASQEVGIIMNNQGTALQ